MRTGLATLSAMFLAVAASQPATSDVVVELFTSQGCSSCPPADELLGQLVKKDGVIALSLHVDYWDYLGWKDAFAQPKFTQRQRAYAAIAGSSMIYTPQMVVGGTESIVGTRGLELSETISLQSAQTPPVSLTAARNSGGVTIDVQASGNLPSGMVVFLVQFSPTESVEIKRGENAGREISYHNVVKTWEKVADWTGTAPLSVNADTDETYAGAVIVQDSGSGRILAATKLD